MNPFLRFVIAVVLIGAVINLALVLTGNRLGAAGQKVKLELERRQLAAMYAKLAEPPTGPCAYLAVESQELSDSQIRSTKLLVKLVGVDAEGNQVELPTRRIVVPGGMVHLRATAVAFGPDLPLHEFLRDKKLYFLSDIYGSDAQPESERARFFIPGEVPLIIANRESEFEVRLWGYVGNAMRAMADSGSEARAGYPGVSVTFPRADLLDFTGYATGPQHPDQYRTISVNESGVIDVSATGSGIKEKMLKEADALSAP